MAVVLCVAWERGQRDRGEGVYSEQPHSLVMCLIEPLCLQVDILSNDGEVQEVVQFVSDNAKRVLNVDTARVIPISSRLALDAKLAAGDEATGESSCCCSIGVMEARLL